jgi:formate dehydrogenase beta subunit
MAKLPALLDADVRVIPAPCVGRCEAAPVAVVHQHPVVEATPDTVVEAVGAGRRFDASPACGNDLAHYVAAGGYRLLDECLMGTRTAESVIAALEHAGLRGLGGAGRARGSSGP